MLRRVGLYASRCRGSAFASRRGCSTTTSSDDSSSTVTNQSRYEALLSALKENESVLAKLSTESLYGAAACDNLRKETEKAKANAELQAVEAFAKDMLEVCDALQVIAAKVDEYKAQAETISPAHMSVLTGVKLTEEVALKSLKRYGVSKVFTVIGTPFDEKCHEKLYIMPSSTEMKAGSVADVIKDGYLMNGVILRKAQVAVSEDP